MIPDSGYVGQGDIAGLTSILTRSRHLHDTIEEDLVAPLPLHLAWLTDHANLDTLIREVTQAGVPIAVVLEHKRDPLGIRRAVDGLIQLLTVPVPVLVLRCGIAALGALAYGATAAAVGTSTTLRHLYPAQPGGGGRFTPAPQTAAVLKPCLAYYSLDKIRQVMQPDPDNIRWRCDCDHCGGRRLDRIWASHDPDTSAFLHSLNTLYEIRNDIMGHATTSSQRQQSWASQCSHALFIHETIRETLLTWTLPSGLKYWAARFTPSWTPQPSPGSESPGKPVPPPTD